MGKNLQVIFFQTNDLPPRLVPKWHECGVGDAFRRVVRELLSIECFSSPAVENRWISCASNGLTVAAQDA
jgi:hypothetical protein